ncbi:hypothetical protein K458DRAFT_75781 [Lentithecium fluviatile CBS 122367]|uniref:Uncharacterized protein n=1 Tax=Lentithecium fluviatile CBS 122367 TaxID=1168545 RepID=A0A6G1IVJ1_9PLEO|nr:hypothetical protein K458DRAFT_75781 [Lentithecium fluviatile CBS 122367]
MTRSPHSNTQQGESGEEGSVIRIANDADDDLPECLGVHRSPHYLQPAHYPRWQSDLPNLPIHPKGPSKPSTSQQRGSRQSSVSHLHIPTRSRRRAHSQMHAPSLFLAGQVIPHRHATSPATPPKPKLCQAMPSIHTSVTAREKFAQRKQKTPDSCQTSSKIRTYP